jgi:hypothetical protein
VGKTIYNFRENKIGLQTYTFSGHSVFYKNAKGEIFPHLRCVRSWQ